MRDAADVTARCLLLLSADRTDETDLFHLQIIVFNRFVTYNLFINIFSHVQYVDGYILYFVNPPPVFI